MKISKHNINVWLTLFMLVSMLAGSMSLKAEGGTWRYDAQKGTLTKENIVLQNVTASNERLKIGDNRNFTETTLDLSSSVDGEYTITSIGGYAFKDCGNLTTVTLGNQLDTIGNSAFQKTGITSITIPASVKRIEYAAFNDCSSLASITFEGANITDLFTIISNTAITSFTIPASVTSLYKDAFGNTKLTSLKIPATVTKFYDEVFKGSSDLKEITCYAATKPTGVNESEKVAGRIIFAPNATTTNWRASSWGADEVRYGADWKYSKADNTITRNGLVLTVTANDKELTITGLKSGTITKLDLTGTIGLDDDADYTIVKIGSTAFQNKTALTTLTLPATVATIGDNAFDGCSALATINCLGLTEPASISTSAFTNGPSEGRKVFAFAASDITSWNADNIWGTNSTVINKFNWTYKDGKLSNPDKSIELTATLADNKITVSGSTTLATNADLDLSGFYGDEEKNIYPIVAIAANAFTGKSLGTVTIPASVTNVGDNAFNGTTITTLNMLGDTPPATVGTNAFKLKDTHTCTVRVPDGKLAAYHKESATNYENWCNLPYILEVKGETYAITYDWVSSEMSKADVLFPSFEAAKTTIGQWFKFPIKAADTKYGLQVKAYDKDTEITDNFRYEKDTVYIKLANKPTDNFTFKVYLVKPITEETSNDITIKSEDEYVAGPDTKPYNGQIGDGTKETEVKSLTVDNTSTELTVLLNQVKVAAAQSGSSSTTITASTEVTFSLIGTNDLGKVENNGTLTLEAADNTASLNTTNTVVENKGVFTDLTGSLTTVSGDADLTVSNTSASEEKVKEGAVITLTAEGTSTNGTAISYQWDKKEGNSWSKVKEGTITKAAAANELEVAAADAGDYRCLITTENNTVKTTLTHYTTVKVETSNPTPPPYIPSYYNVTVHATEGASTSPKAGTYVVEEGYNFTFSLTLEEGYKNSTPVVKANGVVIAPRESDGKYIVRNVSENTDIVIEGVMKDNPTGNAKVEGIVKVQAVAGILHIYLPQNETVTIFTASGLLYKEEMLAAGNSQMQLARGIYFVKIAGKTYKVAF